MKIERIHLSWERDISLSSPLEKLRIGLKAKLSHRHMYRDLELL